MQATDRKEIKDLIPTRQSLLTRLKDWEDQDGWREFFDTYWKLIYNTALKAGLTDEEAQDVVQETVISISKSMAKGFKYDSANGSFKSWLLTLTEWRIVDELRKRPQHVQLPTGSKSSVGFPATQADLNSHPLEGVWDEEWEKNILEVALERVKKKANPKQYQIYELHMMEAWPVARVARALNVGSATVYVAKHRINNLLKKELNKLQKRPM